jgi:hypothetical protein
VQIFEFVNQEKAKIVDISIPKADLKTLKRIAVRERSDGISPILRAILRSFIHEYRLLEARGDRLPDGWVRHEPSDASKLVRVRAVLPESEVNELRRVAEAGDGRFTFAALCRAILRAFVIAQERADAANRPIDSSDLFRISA